MTFKTYQYADKNSDAVITISEESEEDAERRLKEILIYPQSYRLSNVVEE